MRTRRERRGLADVLGERRRHPAELAGQESREPVALGILEHLEQRSKLDAVGMRLDLAWRWRELVVRPGMLFRFALRGKVRQLDVRIRDDGLLDVLVHRGPPFLVTTLYLDGDLRPALALPLNSLFLENPRLVLLRIYLDFKVKGGPRWTSTSSRPSSRIRTSS